MALQFQGGNKLTLLITGGEYFPALEAAIASARHEIFLESYIFENDISGRRISKALCEAALRGVAVRLLVDGFGAKDMPLELIEQLHATGVRRMVFRPQIWSLNMQRHRLRRLHRKLAVVDGRVGFIGGINIIDDMDTPQQIPPRFDYATQVEGPLVAQIRLAAARLWARVEWAALRRPTHVRPIFPVDVSPKGHQSAALVVRDNVRHRTDIEEAYLEAVAAAKDEIIIANAYFFPGQRFRRALTDAAARGVNVTLLLQGRMEYLLLHYASRALYGSLLDAGVNIFEYHRSFLHAKVAVVDGRWATVGSSNIDPFSLLLAREANLVINDREFAGALRLSLHEAMETGAMAVLREHWRHKPAWKRVPIWMGYGVARFLMGMFGYGGVY